MSAYSVTEPSKASKWFAAALVCLYTIITLLPLVWIISTSFKTGPDSISYPPKVFFEPTVEGYVNLYFYFSATAERYQASTYDVDVTVFKAEEVWPIQPHDYYWSRHVTGDLQVRSVPGNHHSMFYHELVPQLAATVQARLAEIETDAVPPS